MSCMSQNFRLLYVSNLSARNFRIFLLMYPWFPARPAPHSLSTVAASSGAAARQVMTGQQGVRSLGQQETDRATVDYHGLPVLYIILTGHCVDRSLCGQVTGVSDGQMTRCPGQYVARLSEDRGTDQLVAMSSGHDIVVPATERRVTRHRFDFISATWT